MHNTKTIVAVYGTLLTGFGNHVLLEEYEGDVRFMGKGESLFFGTMYSCGGFPILSLAEPDSKVKVELYEVGEETLKSLDCLEGYPGWYNRTIRTFVTEEGEHVKAYIYHQDQDQNLDIVPNGDWKKYRGVK